MYIKYLDIHANATEKSHFTYALWAIVIVTAYVFAKKVKQRRAIKQEKGREYHVLNCEKKKRKTKKTKRNEERPRHKIYMETSATTTLA